MSLKTKNIQEIPLTTGSTVVLSNGEVSLPLASTDALVGLSCTEYTIIGTQALIANFVITMSSPADGTVIEFYWRARCTVGAFLVSILGKTIPADYLLTDFTVKFLATGGSFEVMEFNLDLTKSAQIPGSRLTNNSVDTLQLNNEAVTYAKIQNVTAYSVPVRDAGTSGVLSSVAVPVQSVLGRIAAGFVAITAATNGHVLKMTGGNIGFGQLNFSELAGTAATSQIASKAVTLDKLDSVGYLASQYTDTGTTAVTSEETLFTYTLTGGTIDTDGDGIEIVVAGTTAANNHVKTIRVKFAGNTYSTNSVTTAPNGLDWFAQIRILRAGATAAVGKGSLVVSTNNEGIAINKAGVTWANNNDVLVTGQNGTATINDIVVSLVTVSLIR